MNILVKVKKLSDKVLLPKHATAGSAGVDLYANIEEPIILYPGDTVVIPTGIAVELPPYYEMQVRPRSGLAVNNNITVLNTPGTIDSDYRGEVGVVIYYAISRKSLYRTILDFVRGYVSKPRGEEDAFAIMPNTKIAQAVFTRYAGVDWVLVDELSETERGDGKFGSTGK